MLGTVAKSKPQKSDDSGASGFGARLRAIREAKGLTLEELGERIGVHFTALSRLERGKHEPTWPTVLKLAEALGVEVSEFAEPKKPPKK